MAIRRILIANFDCEQQFAQLRCPGPHKAIPQRVAAALAQASTHLAVFLNPGDALWTMSELPQDTLPGMQLLSGERATLPEVEQLLYWGQSEEFVPSALIPHANAEPLSWQESLWHLRCSRDIAADANDRRLSLTIDSDEKYRLAGISLVDSMAEFDHYIASAPLGKGDAWVAKVPYSASGRDRVCRHGRILDGEMRVRTERLLSRFGQLIIEPWVERERDYGTCGLITEDDSEIRIFAPHRLYSDNVGVFRGIGIADQETEVELGSEFTRELNHTAKEVARVLFAQGYRGPFGVDSYTYVGAGGSRRLQSLCEVNARLSFGHVARAQAENAESLRFEFSL